MGLSENDWEEHPENSKSDFNSIQTVQRRRGYNPIEKKINEIRTLIQEMKTEFHKENN